MLILKLSGNPAHGTQDNDSVICSINSLFSELVPLLPGNSDSTGNKNTEQGILRYRAMWLAAGRVIPEIWTDGLHNFAVAPWRIHISWLWSHDGGIKGAAPSKILIIINTDDLFLSFFEKWMFFSLEQCKIKRRGGGECKRKVSGVGTEFINHRICWTNKDFSKFFNA